MEQFFCTAEESWWHPPRADIIIIIIIASMSIATREAFLEELEIEQRSGTSRVMTKTEVQRS
jgi:hypothetical protein